MRRLLSWRIEPLMAGLLLALLTVVAGQFSGWASLEHYGFCTTCNGHDLIVGIADRLSILDVNALTAPVVWPVFTTVGVVAGAWLSARLNGEMPRIRPKVEWPSMGGRFLQGMFAMSFALLAMGCPIRMTIRAADLSLQGAVGLIGVAIGVTVGVAWLRFRSSW